MAAAMEQTQGLSLQQALSPQMQQSLHLLQAPILELRQLVAAELMVNPVLEEITTEPVEREKEKDSSLDEQWDRYYEQSGRDRDAEDRRQHFFDSITELPSLQSHLLSQLGGSNASRHVAMAAIEIIGNLDDDGILRTDLPEMAMDTRMSDALLQEALNLVQTFDPPGVGARNLRECLLLQLRRQDREGSLEYLLVDGHLDAVARKKYPDLARQLGFETAMVQQAADQIAGLDPHPGRQFSSVPEQYVVADVTVEPTEDGFSITLNNSEIPQLRISNAYKDMLSSSASDRSAREYIREKIRGGKFFIKSIQQRQQTILSIAREIVARQGDFLTLGPDHLKPMTMSQVAETVGVHETTVSRAVAGKYIQTPQGLFEMKYFFTTGYQTSAGESVSNETVRRAIVELVREEDAEHPLSDQEMVHILTERGIPIARRTIAKYREQLDILPSHLRKRYSTP